MHGTGSRRTAAGMVALLTSVLGVAGCPSSEPPGTGGDGGTADAADAGPGDGEIDSAVDALPDAPFDADPIPYDAAGARNVSCADPVPVGADEAAAWPTYAGTCPTLVPGANSLESGGATRSFLLVTPTVPVADEVLPVLFLWHWLGGSATGFLERGGVQTAVDQDRFLAVIPEAKGDILAKWPFLADDARLQSELTFFDDMLACVAAEFEVNRNCVGSVGVSAGALWTAQLAARRSTHISSFASLSGGTDNTFVLPWAGAEHPMPVLVLWGGPNDRCFIQFEPASRNLERDLAEDGHFLVECIHNCGHAEPPFEVPAGVSPFAFVWRFALDHPYWLADEESPYLVRGLPENTPDWCAIGEGRATMRDEADCPANACAP